MRFIVCLAHRTRHDLDDVSGVVPFTNYRYDKHVNYVPGPGMPPNHRRDLDRTWPQL